MAKESKRVAAELKRLLADPEHAMLLDAAREEMTTGVLGLGGYQGQVEQDIAFGVMDACGSFKQIFGITLDASMDLIGTGKQGDYDHLMDEWYSLNDALIEELKISKS